MKHWIVLLAIVTACMGLGACSQDQRLSQRAADLALAQWANERKFSIDAINIVGIVSMPEQRSARADISFDDLWGFDNEPEITGIKGTATASFTRYDDGRWVLTSIAMQDRSWDKLAFEAVENWPRLQALKDANKVLVAENQAELLARREAARFMGKSGDVMLAIIPLKNAIAEFAVANGRLPAADEVQIELQNPLISSATWDGTNIIVIVDALEFGAAGSELAFSVTPTVIASGGVRFACEATAGAQYLTCL